MQSLSHPLARLRRLRASHGYGVHSPFAYAFITEVVRAREPYYAYAPLRQTYGGGDARRLRLLFRLVNFARPRRLALGSATAPERAYMQAATRAESGETGDFLFLTGPYTPREETDVVVVPSLQARRDAWQSVLADPRRTAAFDLYDLGVAFFRPALPRQEYKIMY